MIFLLQIPSMFVKEIYYIFLRELAHYFFLSSFQNIARVGSLSRFTRELINSRVPPEDTPIVDVLNIDAKVRRGEDERGR